VNDLAIEFEFNESVFLSFAEDYGRLIEIFDFPEGLITRDLLVLFREFR